MILWIYYTTDGDSGYYDIRIFSSKSKAEKYLKKTEYGKGYGRIEEIEVDEEE